MQFHLQYAAAGSRVYLNRETTYKLVYVKSGAGLHQIQRVSVAFSAGDIFVAAPGEEVHFLQCSLPAELLVVSFTALNIGADNREKHELLRLLQYANHNPLYIYALREDTCPVTQLMDTLARDINSSYTSGSWYQQQLVYLILLMTGEKIRACLPPNAHCHDKKTIDLLHYIHLNIFHPEKLTTTALGQEFFIAPAYIGRYFKNNTRQNLHQYILSYKIKLIENRLINSNMRICEIADEFGFTDKSYLNKLFLKFHGISPLAYRNKYRSPAL